MEELLVFWGIIVLLPMLDTTVGMEQVWQVSVCGCRVYSDFTGRTSDGVAMSIQFKLTICRRRETEKVWSPIDYIELT